MVAAQAPGMINAFPRNPDGSLKTKKGCQTPGCDHPNWHVCLVGKPDTTAEVLVEQARRRKEPIPDSERQNRSEAAKKRWATDPRRRKRGGPITKEQESANKSKASQIRWEKEREENRERDAKIVEIYTSPRRPSIRMIAKDFGMSDKTVRAVLQAAQERGEPVRILPPGTTLRNGAK